MKLHEYAVTRLLEKERVSKIKTARIKYRLNFVMGNMVGGTTCLNKMNVK